MDIELLKKAVDIWRDPKLNEEDYHASTGYLSNSFIGDFLGCEYGAIIDHAIKPEEENFNENFAIGHLVEAEIFEGNPGRERMLKRFKDDAVKPVTKEAMRLYNWKCNAVRWHREGDDFKYANGHRPDIQQEDKFRKYLEKEGYDLPAYPAPEEKPWVTKSHGLAESVLRHPDLKRLLRAEGSIYHQIITFNLYGLPWRGEVDYLNLNKRTEIDMKTTASDMKTDFKWNKETRNNDITFIDLWNYHRQRALYQFGIKVMFDEHVTPRILAVSKKTQSVRLFNFNNQERLNWEIKNLSPIADRVKQILDGAEPELCEICPRCVETEKPMEIEIQTDSYCQPWFT